MTRLIRIAAAALALSSVSAFASAANLGPRVALRSSLRLLTDATADPSAATLTVRIHSDDPRVVLLARTVESCLSGTIVWDEVVCTSPCGSVLRLEEDVTYLLSGDGSTDSAPVSLESAVQAK